MTTRQRLTFAGVTFTGHAHSTSHVSVPVPAFRKMLASGKLRPHLSYDIEHDGNGTYDRFNEDVRAEAFCAETLKRLEHAGRPWLLYLNPASDGAEPVLHYCPHSNLSYRCTEVGQ